MPADKHQVYLSILLMKRRITEEAVIQLETSVCQRISVGLQLRFFLFYHILNILHLFSLPLAAWSVGYACPRKNHLYFRVIMTH